MVLPRAGASLSNPDVQLPILRSDGDGYYLEMRVEVDGRNATEVAVTRRVPLENVSEEEWEELQAQCSNLDLQSFPGADLTLQQLLKAEANPGNYGKSVEIPLFAGAVWHGG